MKKQFKRILATGMAMMMLLACTACGGSTSNSDTPGNSETSDDPYADLPKVEWKFTHSQSADHFQQVAFQAFADYMSEQSGGKFTVELYHSGTLGTEQEVIESMQAGSIQGTVAAASLLANFAPCYNLFALPALFKDSDQLNAVMTNATYTDKLADACADVGLIDYGYYQSFFRQIYTKTPIEGVSDFTAQKIRVMSSDIILNSMQALGCNATTTAWTELYSALQLGVCDGLDHVPSSVKSMAFYENLGYVCSPNLFVTPMFVIVSQSCYDELPDAYKALVDDGINNVLVPQLREMADTAFDEDLAWLTSEGGLTYTECDVEAIHEAVADVRDQYIAQQEQWVQDLAHEILAQ